jgi:hypothetical protein
MASAGVSWSPVRQIASAGVAALCLLSSPLLFEQESKSKSHATHALDTPLSIYVDLREVEGER